MGYSIEHNPDCLFDENYIEDGSWSRCSCLHSPLENYGSPEYDVQRWDHCYWWEDGMQPVEDGPWVLAWEAEAHEKTAVQQAISDCIVAVEALDYPHIGSSSVVQVDQVINILRDLKRGAVNE